MRRTSVLAIFLLLALSLILGQGLPLLGQTPPPWLVYPSFLPTTEYQAVFELWDRQGGEAARAEFARLAAQNPGTTLAAQCLLMVAEIQESKPAGVPAALQTYQEIIRQFPRSRFEIWARQYTINDTVNSFRQPQQWKDAMDQLLLSLGAPTHLQIIRSNGARALVEQVRQLPPGLRDGLDGVYLALRDRLAVQEERFSDAVALSLFCREALFDAPESVSFSSALREDLSAAQFGPDTPRPAPPQLVDPTIAIKAPKSGHQKGPRPKLRVQITDGDYLQPQVDLTTLKFTLDGQDLTPLLRVRSKIESKLKPGKIFERVRLTTRPTTPLAAGAHTLEISVQVMGYAGTGPGFSRVTSQFNVKSGRGDDPEDECDDDQDDWGND